MSKTTWWFAVRLVIATVLSGAATNRAFAQDTEFYGWPHELESQAAVIAARIEQHVGERPRVMLFTKRDSTMEVFFWNPRLWHDDTLSSVFPMQSVPLVKKFADDVAAFVWANFGQDGWINAIHVSFMRVRTEKQPAGTRELPAQEAAVHYSRRYLHDNRAEIPGLTFSPRSGNECTGLTPARCLGFSFLVPHKAGEERKP